MDFESWLRHIGKSSRSAKSYAGAISGVMSNWAKQTGLVKVSLLEIDDQQTLLDISVPLSKLDIFIERNTKGKGMYAAALRKYAEYLEDIYSSQVTYDIENIVRDDKIGETEKSTYINARVGQGKFRQSLIDLWNGCSVTGFADTRFLVASHIKPWKVCCNVERLDVYNGLLLLPNLDKVFDLGYISFDESGSIMIHNELDQYEKLGIRDSLKVNLSDKHQENMEYHRNSVFKG